MRFREKESGQVLEATLVFREDYQRKIWSLGKLPLGICKLNTFVVVLIVLFPLIINRLLFIS